MTSISSEATVNQKLSVIDPKPVKEGHIEQELRKLGIATTQRNITQFSFGEAILILLILLMLSLAGHPGHDWLKHQHLSKHEFSATVHKMAVVGYFFLMAIIGLLSLISRRILPGLSAGLLFCLKYLAVYSVPVAVLLFIMWLFKAWP